MIGLPPSSLAVASGDEGRLGHQPAHLADRRDELGDGVLGGDGVVEDGRVEGPAVLARKHAGGFDHGADGVEDPLWALRAAQAGAPVGEDGEVEARIVEGEPAGHLPVDAGPQLPARRRGPTAPRAPGGP